MKFGCFFVGQRPQLHEQYADGSKANPKPVQKPHPPIWMAVTRSPESVDIAVRNPVGA